ncbi:M20 metallopeptidase family protein [Paenibacillus cremeus]|uniref:Amidohydrolase n=1 Tax=Paenibacillus cremeus TaxID=2163881 RepID=A0A559KH80_9BACL|nr:M20 family metallopeptidase [Paenibacillus cremeus]TVY11438.1 amidohydrolase [Paenibacillus cremeus]
MGLDLIAVRRDLHMHPETAFHEHRTAQVIEEHLHRMGLETRRCAGTGVVADIDGLKPGPTVALRADIDALPVEEATGFDYASLIPGSMHACGHDAHTAIVLGAAELLLQRRSEIKGRVRLIFQPAEEVAEGAKLMIEQGVLDGVNVIYGLHVASFLPFGKIAFRTGMGQMAAADRFTVTIGGKGGAAGLPHLTTDPLVAAAGVILGLQTAVSRAINPVEPVVVSIGRLAGADAYNVIPEQIELEGTTRYFNPQVGTALPALLQTIACNIASGYRCTAELHYWSMCPPVVNADRPSRLARRAAVQIVGESNVLESPQIMPSDDFAVYQQHVDGCYVLVGAEGPYAHHHPKFTIDERCLSVGAEWMARAALESLQEVWGTT